MDDENLTLVPIEELPQTDAGKPEKPRVNNLQENFVFLLEKRSVTLAVTQKETLIAWPTLYGWYKGDVKAQMLDLNVKELASFLGVSLEELAFSDLRNEDSKSL